MSRKTTAGRAVATASRGLVEVAASATWKPSSSRLIRQSSRSAGSSSTMRIDPAGRSRSAIVVDRARLGCVPWRRRRQPRSGTRPRWASSGAASRTRSSGSRRSRARPALLDDDSARRASRPSVPAARRDGAHVSGWRLRPAPSAPHQELWAALARRPRRDRRGRRRARRPRESRPSSTLVHEWRGALFRVRLARHRLVAPRRPARPVVEDRPRSRAAPRIGARGRRSGDVRRRRDDGPWPIWAGGLLAFLASVLLYRP